MKTIKTIKTKSILEAQNLYIFYKNKLDIEQQQYDNDPVTIAANKEEKKGNYDKADKLFLNAELKYDVCKKRNNLRLVENELIRHGLELIKDKIKLDDNAKRKIKTYTKYRNKFIKITMSLDTSTLPKK